MIEADEIRRRMPAIIAGEVAAINRTFAGTRPGRNPPAVVSQNLTVVAGRSYIAYGLRLYSTVLPQDVEKLLPKLSEALSALRRRPTDVRLRRKPLALEVAHPFPAPLDWRRARTQLQPDTMLTGRNYSGGEPCDDVLRFDDTPHVLIAGTTGSGKSTLLRMMIATLALNTSPDALRLYLVDLKNTDLKPFRGLPHAELFAGEENEARQAIRIVHREVRRRKDMEDIDAPRIVLVIDELAEVGDRDTLDLLSSILRIGRSFRVNVVAATQLPTKATCGEKNNYTVRFVGAVTDAQTAALAAGRGDSGAHLLPGKGAFLRVEGTTLERLQAYHLDMAGTATMVQQAVQRWGSGYKPVQPAVNFEPSEPVCTGYNRQNGAFLPVSVQKTAPRAVTGSVVTVTFPLPTNRPPSPTEASALRQLFAQTGSKNEVMRQAYGSKNGAILGYVNQALSEGGAA